MYRYAYVSMYEATRCANTFEWQIRKVNFITRGDQILPVCIYHISPGGSVICQQNLKFCWSQCDHSTHSFIFGNTCIHQKLGNTACGRRLIQINKSLHTKPEITMFKAFMLRTPVHFDIIGRQSPCPAQTSHFVFVWSRDRLPAKQSGSAVKRDREKIEGYC